MSLCKKTLTWFLQGLEHMALQEQSPALVTQKDPSHPCVQAPPVCDSPQSSSGSAEDRFVGFLFPLPVNKGPYASAPMAAPLNVSLLVLMYMHVSTRGFFRMSCYTATSPGCAALQIVSHAPALTKIPAGCCSCNLPKSVCTISSLHHFQSSSQILALAECDKKKK